LNPHVTSCMETALKGKAFSTKKSCIIPIAVAKKLNGLIELPVYGGTRCQEACSIGEKCWILPKNVHQDVQEAIAAIG